MKTRQIPTYLKYECLPKQHDYCAVVFVINEGERLHNQLRRMKYLASNVDLVIADGGSDDGSTDLDILKEFDINTLLIKTGAGKLGSQMRMAFAWALDRNYKGVVVVDGNNKDSVEDVPRFISKLEEGFDHIQGSRFIPGGHHENTPLSRLIGLKILHAPLISQASGFRYSDTTNGFRAYSSNLLQDNRLDVFRDVFEGYELHYYIAIRAPKLGFKCIEVPVSRIYPAKGAIPTKISPIRGSIDVLYKLFFACFGGYNPRKCNE